MDALIHRGKYTARTANQQDLAASLWIRTLLDDGKGPGIGLAATLCGIRQVHPIGAQRQVGDPAELVIVSHPHPGGAGVRAVGYYDLLPRQLGRHDVVHGEDQVVADALPGTEEGQQRRTVLVELVSYGRQP